MRTTSFGHVALIGDKSMQGHIEQWVGQHASAVSPVLESNHR